MFWLSDEFIFPHYSYANEDGILALGGDLSTERLILAYKNGIFPWYNEDEPIIWYCPSERMVLFPDEVKVSKSMKQILRKQNFTITKNTAFEQVIFHCKTINRKDQFGTWITDDMQQAYINLHKKGLAKSIEVWQDNELVGGLYGIDLGNGIFCGESMFSKRSNMSKIAFIHLARNGNYKLIDCQVYNSHLASLGAREISRDDFLKFFKN